MTTDVGAAPSSEYTLEDVDLANLDRFRDNEGWAQFAALRAGDPVHWNEESDGKGFWAVTKYDDIWAVDKDSETFTSEKFVNLEDVDDDLMDADRLGQPRQDRQEVARLVGADACARCPLGGHAWNITTMP